MKHQLATVAAVIHIVACSGGTDYDVAEDPPVGKGGSTSIAKNTSYSGGTSSTASVKTSAAETGGAMTFSSATRASATSEGGAPTTRTAAAGSSAVVTLPAATGGTTASFVITAGASSAHTGTLLVGTGGISSTIAWTTSQGGLSMTIIRDIGSGGSLQQASGGSLQQTSGVTYTTGTSTFVLFPEQGDAPCMLDSHCESGFVCSMQGASPDLAAMGIGHCVASGNQGNNGSGGMRLN
ncbi:MAG TPA: hypothetical protein VIV60_18655 [Polyangiaceae bacterium]